MGTFDYTELDDTKKIIKPPENTKREMPNIFELLKKELSKEDNKEKAKNDLAEALVGTFVGFKTPTGEDIRIEDIPVAVPEKIRTVAEEANALAKEVSEKPSIQAVELPVAKVEEPIVPEKVVINTNTGGGNTTVDKFRENTAFTVLMLFFITLAQVTLFWRPIVGIYFNALALAVLVGIALWRESVRQLAISLAIIPVSLMVVLSLPHINMLTQLTVFYISILVLAMIYRFLFTLDHPIEHSKLNIFGYFRTIPVMLVGGEILGLIGYLMLRNHYIFGNTSLGLLAVTVVVFALAEETLFRGLIQNRASQVMHPVIAALLTAFLFALISIGHETYLAPLFSLILGLALAFIYYRKQNIILTFTLNAISKLAYIGLITVFILH